MNTCISYLRNLDILLMRETTSGQAALKAMLESCGAKVTACRSTQELFHSLESCRASVDAILIDLPLTGQEAYTMLLRLRQVAPQIPLVIVGPMRDYEGYSFPFGLDITARTFEPLSVSQLESCFCNFL